MIPPWVKADWRAMLDKSVALVVGSGCSDDCEGTWFPVYDQADPEFWFGAESSEHLARRRIVHLVALRDRRALTAVSGP